MSKQRIFFMIKPDGIVIKDKIIAIVKRVANIVDSKTQNPVEILKIERLYEMHREKIFYPRLLNFFRGQSIIVLLLEEKDNFTYKKDFINDFIELVGDTDPANAKAGTIRSLSNDSLACSMAEKRALLNLVHRSTSIEEAERESKIFFNNL